MDSKSKAGQKVGESHAKQQPPRPGTEQVQSGTNIQKSESERVQTQKVGEQLKQKQVHQKSGKK
jgi:hypothetical protein